MEGAKVRAEISEQDLLNPTLLVEVLSDSTEADGCGRKFEHYRRITSLRGYLLVSQKEPRVELFTRTPNGEWVLHEAAGMNSSLAIPSLNISLELADAFSQVTFVSSPFRQGSDR